ncbi:oligopeptidase B [Natronospira proteinivora]|uniref:Oligopeptidase B n=1 Tax=Natronospira proteinivora TaxID=1807133 RepID=A0ABT1GBU9_9GAMM|nr:S9 family peptidase [Natronospira proteinivora]MCP1727763.1 oligopeptidase B [Natronospira proteinivora]
MEKSKHPAARHFAQQADIQAPPVPRQDKTIEQHGESRQDPYHWLRDDNWQALLRDPSLLKTPIREQLAAENRYHDAMMADAADLREALFQEMRGRIKEDDASVPEADGPYEYYLRFREGGDYPLFARRSRGKEEETILFDGDAEGRGQPFFSIASVDHSRDHRLIAYGVDTTGSEYYTLRVRDTETGQDLPDVIESTDGGVVWAADSKSFFYVERDDNQRPKRVKQHYLGQDPADDRIVFDEPDDGQFVSVSETQSGDYILISSGNHDSSETRFIPATQPDAEPQLIAPRKDDVLYEVEHRGEHFYILTNIEGAIDFKIVRTPITRPAPDNWEDVVAHQPGRHISDFVCYKNHWVRLERVDAKPRLVIDNYQGENREVPMEAEAYHLGLRPGLAFDTQWTRFVYSTPAQPAQTFDYHMATGERRLRKTQVVPSGHDPDRYVVERLDAETADGAMVPIIILRLKSTPVDGSAPVLLYGYGSYGMNLPDAFSLTQLSLVDRGVIYAVAKVRGGSEKGQPWYRDGKLQHKPNSFQDCLTAARALVEHRYTQAGRIVLDGRSAGGLLVGATLNLDPEYFAGAIGGVPFVDVLNTISDPSLPLTPPEWPEWGNPIESEADYQTIKSYSPYENLRDDAVYPPVMATAGLADFRVTYWEPAKWIARLRAETRGGPYLLKTNMEAGHGGSAARFEALKEEADLFAFALKVMGKLSAKPSN